MKIIPDSENEVQHLSSEKQPPASNTGVKTSHAMVAKPAKAQLEAMPMRGLNEPQARTGTRIDWLSVTLKDWKENLYPDGLSEIWVPESPKNSYDLARRFSDGRLELSHSTRHEMGIHIMFTGDAMDNVAKCGYSHLELLRWYFDKGAAIRRLDVALDAWGSGIDLIELHNIFDAGAATTKVKKGNLVQGSGEQSGTTVYIGSRQSEAFARFYDKAAEQNVIGDWLRFEVQFSDSKAITAANTLLQAVDHQAAIIGLIRGFCDFPDTKKWTSILMVKPNVITRANKSGTDTEKWLIDTCAPSLAREIVKSGSMDISQRFWERVMFEIIGTKADESMQAHRESLQHKLADFLDTEWSPGQ